MNPPDHLKFLESHEWIALDADAAAVGISDYAQAELSDVVYVELPEIGRRVAANEAVAVIESVKAASDIFAPVSGEIVEVNAALEADPALVNHSPYEKGWLFKIKPSDRSEFDSLKSASDYQASCD